MSVHDPDEQPPTRRGADLRKLSVRDTPHPELLLRAGVAFADVLRAASEVAS